MHALSKMAVLGLMGTVAFMVGCVETYHVTITNHTPVVQQVVIEMPNVAERFDFTIDQGRSVIQDIKVDKEDLPTGGTISAGNVQQPFTLDKKTKKDLYVYINEGRIVGPIDQNTKYTIHSTKQMPRKVEETETIHGDTPAPKPEAPKPGDSEEVVE